MAPLPGLPISHPILLMPKDGRGHQISFKKAVQVHTYTDEGFIDRYVQTTDALISIGNSILVRQLMFKGKKDPGCMVFQEYHVEK